MLHTDFPVTDNELLLHMRYRGLTIYVAYNIHPLDDYFIALVFNDLLVFRRMQLLSSLCLEFTSVAACINFMNDFQVLPAVNSV